MSCQQHWLTWGWAYLQNASGRTFIKISSILTFVYAFLSDVVLTASDTDTWTCWRACCRITQKTGKVFMMKPLLSLCLLCQVLCLSREIVEEINLGVIHTLYFQLELRTGTECHTSTCISLSCQDLFFKLLFILLVYQKQQAFRRTDFEQLRSLFFCCQNTSKGYIVAVGFNNIKEVHHNYFIWHK